MEDLLKLIKKINIHTLLDEVLYLFLINMFVAIFWYILELLYYGQLKPCGTDSIISFILTISIRINIYFISKYLKDSSDESSKNKDKDNIQFKDDL